jgi:hypothetical protein
MAWWGIDGGSIPKGVLRVGMEIRRGGGSIPKGGGIHPEGSVAGRDGGGGDPSRRECCGSGWRSAEACVVLLGEPRLERFEIRFQRRRRTRKQGGSRTRRCLGGSIPKGVLRVGMEIRRSLRGLAWGAAVGAIRDSISAPEEDEEAGRKQNEAVFGASNQRRWTGRCPPPAEGCARPPARHEPGRGQHETPKRFFMNHVPSGKATSSTPRTYFFNAS